MHPKLLLSAPCARLFAARLKHTCRVSLETPLCKNTRPHTCKTASAHTHAHTDTHRWVLHWSLLSASL